MNARRVPAYMELNGHKTEIGTALVDIDMGCADITVSNTSAIDILRAKSIGNVSLAEDFSIDSSQLCADHKPVQHRDAKPPWCRKCGLTAGYEFPVGRFGKIETLSAETRNSDHDFTD